MRQCLDEATLQSYFDGELSSALMESATLHLGSCATCAAAARELEEESLLLSNALASEFEAPVPTEQLRQRIEAAISGMQPSHTHVENIGVLAGFRKSLSDLFSFTPQRTLAYASLMVVLAFAAIFGIIKLRQPVQRAPQAETIANNGGSQPKDTPKIENSVGSTSVPKDDPSRVVAKASESPRAVKSPVKSPRAEYRINPANHVKLLPGEKSYLQTIARLDSTINAGNTAMRPALQVEYQRNLAVVDRAIAATRSAAKSNPNDPDAAEFMFSAYQSKVDLLNTIADARVRSH
jgi:anti-sigma factor RsiW